MAKGRWQSSLSKAKNWEFSEKLHRIEWFSTWDINVEFILIGLVVIDYSRQMANVSSKQIKYSAYSYSSYCNPFMKIILNSSFPWTEQSVKRKWPMALLISPKAVKMNSDSQCSFKWKHWNKETKCNLYKHLFFKNSRNTANILKKTSSNIFNWASNWLHYYILTQQNTVVCKSVRCV